MDRNALVTLSNPRSPIAEAYRALRVNLAYAALDRSLQTLVVASPTPETGKSAVAANLAIALAQGGQRVILVDADLRRPQVHRLFGVLEEPGLTGVMRARENEMALPLVATEVPGLQLLPSGSLPPNPADILGSRRMESLLNTLEAQADMVILDAPPINVALDAAVLAARCDGLLLAIRSGHSRRESVNQARAQLERHQVNLLGAVLTDAPDGRLAAGY